MKYTVVIADTAREDFRRLDACWQSAALAPMREHLQHQPLRESKSRIKKLRGLRKPQYRLRVGRLRIFYDVDEATMRVQVLGVAQKTDAASWLR